MKKKIFKIIKRINFLYFMLMFIFMCLKVGMANVNGTVPYFYGYSTVEVVSESMIPTYEIKDKLLIEKVKNNEKLNIGDVYIYKLNDIYVVHRLVDIEGDFLIFKGDNNEACDSPVLKENLEAHVVKKADGIPFYTLIIIVYLGFTAVAGFLLIEPEDYEEESKKTLDM